MLEDILSTVLRTQFRDVGRRTRGALLEVAALGMIGLATIFVFVGIFIWLSGRIEPWQAAFVMGGAALIIAGGLMMVGRALLRRREPDPHEQIVSMMQSLGLLSSTGTTAKGHSDDDNEAGPTMVAAALAAGLMLGRSFKR
ncbi:MAG: phage holin family protein [Roseobacter sp.]